MSRETVRMVREGRRPVASVVVGDEDDRDALLARIAVLEEQLAQATIRFIDGVGYYCLPAVAGWTGNAGVAWGSHPLQGRGLNCRCHDEREDGDGDNE